MDRGAWRATVHRAAQSQTQLKRLSTQEYLSSRRIENTLKLKHTYNILHSFLFITLF